MPLLLLLLLQILSSWPLFSNLIISRVACRVMLGRVVLASDLQILMVSLTNFSATSHESPPAFCFR
jgi:hypothetical protein